MYLGAALLCGIHGATVENIFEDGDGANTFQAFNPNLKKFASTLYVEDGGQPDTGLHSQNFVAQKILSTCGSNKVQTHKSYRNTHR